MNPSGIDFDIVVCGGGMVGATLAALLANQPTLKGLRIALVEAQVPVPPTHDVEIRVSAISRASERILSHAGAWSQINPAHRCAYQEMMVWDHASSTPSSTTVPGNVSGVLQFSAASMAEPNLGYIIANNCIQWAALQACAHTGVTRFAASVATVAIDDVCARIGLSDQRTLSARLLIGADGARSASRECVGIVSHVRPYQQTAFVTHIRTERAHQHTAWQRFLVNGPIALLPLNDGRSSIVWTTTPEHAAELMQRNDADLGNAIGSACDHVLGQVAVAGPRAALPLQLAHVDEYCRPGFVLVGDAAHSIHPLAGQGVNLGLMDAASLVQVLCDARTEGASMEELGSMRTLRRYERWRRSENTVVLGMMDGINRLFSNDNPLLGKVRRLGLQTVQRHSMIKHFFTSRALGIAGDAPGIVRSAGQEASPGPGQRSPANW